MLERLCREEEGQGLVEYGLILALVAVAAIVGLQALGGGLKGIFDKLGGGVGEIEVDFEGGE